MENETDAIEEENRVIKMCQSTCACRKKKSLINRSQYGFFKKFPFVEIFKKGQTRLSMISELCF